MTTMEYNHERTKADARSLRDQVLSILKGHVGASKAIQARAIALALHRDGRYADRPVRMAVKQLRREGYLVLSSVGSQPGYYLAATETEWRNFRDGNLKPRALDILETASAMGRAAQIKFAGQAPLPLEQPTWGV